MMDHEGNTMLNFSLCDYSDAHILVKGKRAITGAGDDAAARQANERDKDVASIYQLYW